MDFNPFKKKTLENPKEIKNEPKEEISENSKRFKEKFSSIKFPSDFEIELTNNSAERRPIYFLVKKRGAPNKVSVIGLIGEHGEGSIEWEVMADIEGYGLESGQACACG